MSEDWYTPEMEAAARSLDAVADHVTTVVRDSEALIAEAEAAREPISDEDVARLEKYANARFHTPEWQELKARIAAGELTWRDIASGQALTDPGVAAAAQSVQSLPPPTAEQLADLGLTKPPEPAPTTPPTRRREWADDDDYFDEFSAQERFH
ncbi:hypothetical protein [Amycolatopsis suaedae]|uniref:Uncharacterized protein n=1 Tax=Amycolatopsis suaedae TaxID=2510978 RepID=A0A4Q7J0E1_9PSEU|nr:hypothetical protein [Amycolatopsis suaedae]RZQ60247.1 hypothetical protein EWH70_30140 [Amycolatopsis suaedae]